MVWLRTFLFSLTTPGPDWVAKLGRFRNTKITLTLSGFILSNYYWNGTTLYDITLYEYSCISKKLTVFLVPITRESHVSGWGGIKRSRKMTQSLFFRILHRIRWVYIIHICPCVYTYTLHIKNKCMYIFFTTRLWEWHIVLETNRPIILTCNVTPCQDTVNSGIVTAQGCFVLVFW